MLYGINLTAKLWYKLIVYLLIVTTQSLMMTTAYANVLIDKNIKKSEQEIFDKYVSDANIYGKDILKNAPKINVDNNGSVIHDDKVIMDKETLTGVKENDFIPAEKPEQLYGNDLKILIAGEKANAQYKNKINSSGNEFDNATAQSYDLLKKSFGKQKPTYGDDDPFFDATDDVFTNLEELAEDLANCKVVTDKYPTGNDIHVEKLETCERVVALEDSFTISHAYEVGVIKHNSGAINLNSCGDGCLKTWIGTVGDNYWDGWCKIFEEEMSIQVLRPDAITNVKLEYSKFDDYHQVWINNTKVYNAPNGNFPPETAGECELSKSWELYPNVNLTEYYRNIEPKGVINFKTRTSVAGNGEGFSRIQINYDSKKIVGFDEWATPDQIEKAKKIEQQIETGICTGTIECVDMPVLDDNKCAVINGVKVCENNFAAPPLKNISPFCKKVAVTSSCGNREVCWENIDGETVCHDNSISTNKCQQYTDNNFPHDPAKRCSFKKSECLDGGMGANGTCYIYTDTYDCGFTVNDGAEGEVDSIVCDGKLQCVGESCYKADKDLPNSEFGEAVAYLEMLTFAKNDMKCVNQPDNIYNPDYPVDEYLPVPVCPDGYKFDTTTSQCLKQESCNYDESNFYAVDPRKGIEVLFQANSIVQSSDVKKCSSVKNGDSIFTCGTEKKKVGTDSFHEVCRNKFTNQNGIGCPDSTHELDPVSGFCRVVPVKTCPNGYKLIDLGGDKFNPNNFICRADPVAANVSCSGATPNYNSNSGQCLGESISSASPYCKQGVWNGNQCVTTEIKPTSERCVPPYIPSYCHSAVGVGYCTWRASCGANSSSSVMMYGTIVPYCSVGSLINNTCEVYTNNNPDYSCQSGNLIANNQCSTTIISNPNISCPDASYVLNNKQCTKPDVPATVNCPAQFPEYDSATRSCKTKKPSISDHINKSVDIGDNLISFNHFNQSTSISEHLEEQENLVNKERMLKYAKNKLAILTNEANKLTPEEKQIYNDFKKNLFNNFVSESSQGRFNVNLEQKNKDSGSGNVSCTLFPAESAYCKVAVGGVQDCCENPAPTSMGDYINMTKTMLTLDGLTAELNLIGDYSGVWQPAKDYVSGLADNAITNISETLFSSSADTASGQIAEQVTMDALKQSAMKYTNQIIVDLFGEDVAGMLFQEVAGSATNIALSSGMQTAATAFMYLYYVYMIYVVVNLLINIIWECTEDEMNLAMKRDLLSAHKVGSYCHKKVLGLCVEKRDTFCVYNSPVSRIMMEQIHLQPQMNALGYNYGDVKNPTCKSLTTDDIAMVDFDKVDMSEWIAILIQTDNMPNASKVSVESLTGKDNFLNTSDEVGKQRLNIIKQSQERIKDIDGDTIYNDTYETKWSTLQDEKVK